MSALIEKIRRARETAVEVCGYKFTVRRPTDLEMMSLNGRREISELLPYIVGWSGVREIDVINGGNPTEIEYDAAVAREWLADRPDLLMPLVEAIVKGYEAHAKALEAAKKN